MQLINYNVLAIANVYYNDDDVDVHINEMRIYQKECFMIRFISSSLSLSLCSRLLDFINEERIEMKDFVHNFYDSYQSISCDCKRMGLCRSCDSPI